MEIVLKTNNISKQYKDKMAVNQINMQVKKGDIYGLVGENGAGKTTLMRMIAGLILPTNGEIELFESKELFNARKKMGVLIEHPAVFPSMTARENLTYFQLVNGVKNEKNIQDILKIVGLSNTGKKKVKNFSLGMKQRLGIAIALLESPLFLLLDEPINGLDVAGVKEIRDLLHKINQELGTTILISSHILSELSKVANRFGIIRQGQLIEEVTTRELEERCNHYIEIEVSNPQKALEILDNMEDVHTFKWIQDKTIRIFEKDLITPNVNRELVRNNIDVWSLRLVKEDLESYYLRKNGGDIDVNLDQI